MRERKNERRGSTYDAVFRFFGESDASTPASDLTDLDDLREALADRLGVAASSASPFVGLERLRLGVECSSDSVDESF